MLSDGYIYVVQKQTEGKQHIVEMDVIQQNSG